MRSAKAQKPRLVWWIIGVVAAVLVGSAAGGWIWYQAQFLPVGSDPEYFKKVLIEPGSTPSQIGELLEQEDLVRSSYAFNIYTRLSGVHGSLQAGAYRLSPAATMSQIVDQLVQGAVDRLDITFVPGSTLAKNRQVLIDSGFNESEVDEALARTYDSPLFEGKPSGSDLEGYIFGETYHFNAGVSVQEILSHVFEVFYTRLQENSLPEAFAKQDLTLYQGITLASIVQSEAPGVDDQKIIAQVFWSRLNIEMALGSDVTYQYIADKLGVPRDPGLGNPYNTRRYTGLPPGPISNPGLSALLAVANPADTDYLYFVSGDDDVTYFSRTLQEHEANVAAHCQIKCQEL